MAVLLTSVQPPPFRTPLLDDQGQLVEVWRRFFLSAQAAIVQILAAKPAALVGSLVVPLDDATGLVDDFASLGTQPSALAGIFVPYVGAITNVNLGLFGLTAALLTASGLTPGSVIFAGTGGLLSQNNANFFWDNTNFRLGLFTPTPIARIEVAGVPGANNPEIAITGGTPILSFIGPGTAAPIIGWNATGTLRFATVTGAGAAGFSQKMTIADNGNVTINPGALSVTNAGPIVINALAPTDVWFLGQYTGALAAGNGVRFRAYNSTPQLLGELQISSVNALNNTGQVNLIVGDGTGGTLSLLHGDLNAVTLDQIAIATKQLRITNGTAALPGLAFTTATNRGIYTDGDGILFSMAGVSTFGVGSAGVAVILTNSAELRMGASQDIRLVRSAAGKLNITGSATGIGLDVTTDATLKIRNTAQAAGTGNLDLGAKVTAYNNISTVSGGVPAIYATIDTTGLTANVAAATLYAVPASGAGMYRVSAYVVETTAASVSSTLPNVQVVYTDNDTNGSVTLDVTPILGIAGTGQTGALTANIVGTVSSGEVPINVRASTTIQYQTVNYASSLAGMAYALHLKCEAL